MEASAFDRLFDIAAKRGPALNTLLDRKSIKLAANLKHADPGRFSELLIKLGTWSGKGEFRAYVNRYLGEALDKKAKEKADADADARLEAAVASGKPVIQVGEPVKVAQDFVAQRRPNLIFVDDQFRDWDGRAYPVVASMAIRSALQQFMSSGVDSDRGEPYTPTKRDLDEAFDMLRGEVYREGLHAPMWLTPDQSLPDPNKVIACRNGIIDLTTGELLPATPNLFIFNATDYDGCDWWDANTPKVWLGFLESIWPVAEGGQENQDALQEVMGYLLTHETKFQKIFPFVGATRSGKGTIAGVITGLVGEGNVHNQSITKLGKDFGVKALLDKQIFIDPDLRLGKDSNIGTITGLLLSMSGEDRISVSRKYQDDVQARLTTRAVLMANLALGLPDQSGALHGRYVPLVLSKSFLGKEDLTLAGRLVPELPDILHWALDGLHRLESRVDANGRQVGFVLTTAGKKMLGDIARQASTVNAFVKECCIVEPDSFVTKQALLDAFHAWVQQFDIDVLYTLEDFTKELKPATGYAIDPLHRRRIGGKQVTTYKGIGLRPEFEGLAASSEPDNGDC